MAIINATDPRTIAELQSWNASNPANAPFVKIGQLLLAVDQTGAEAWQPLVNKLKLAHGAKKFAIYSGRHGALEGCFQDNGQVPTTAPDIAFFDDDTREAARFAPLAGVSIDVVDTARLPKALYRQRVITDIISGHWVIVAWCHSIASMTTIPNNVRPDYSRGSVLWVSAQNTTRRRVSDIVKEDYGWVPGAA